MSNTLIKTGVQYNKLPRTMQLRMDVGCSRLGAISLKPLNKCVEHERASDQLLTGNKIWKTRFAWMEIAEQAREKISVIYRDIRSYPYCANSGSYPDGRCKAGCFDCEPQQLF